MLEILRGILYLFLNEVWLVLPYGLPPGVHSQELDGKYLTS